MVNIVFVMMEGEDILGNAHTMMQSLYTQEQTVCQTRIKVAQHRGSGNSTTGKQHPAKAGIKFKSDSFCNTQAGPS